MPLGTEVDLGPGDIVLDGDPAPPPTERGTGASHFSAHDYSGQAETVAHLSNCWPSWAVVKYQSRTLEGAREISLPISLRSKSQLGLVSAYSLSVHEIEIGLGLSNY